jgi:hypothetical protein
MTTAAQERGRQKNKTGDPAGRTGGSATKKGPAGPGPGFFGFFRCGVFELPSPRNAQKRNKLKSRKIGFCHFFARGTARGKKK